MYIPMKTDCDDIQSSYNIEDKISCNYIHTTSAEGNKYTFRVNQTEMPNFSEPISTREYLQPMKESEATKKEYDTIAAMPKDVFDVYKNFKSRYIG